MSAEAEILLNEISSLRSSILSRMYGPKWANVVDVDGECGYPDYITPQDYQKYYDRDGLSKRVVNVLPEECWRVHPEVYETDDPKETEFERQWKELCKSLGVYSYLERLDKLSGIGEYGVMLLGFDDGLTLENPVAGVTGATYLESQDAPTANAEGSTTTTPAPASPTAAKPKRKLLYMRPFAQGQAQITKVEANPTNPRYGQPTEYNLLISTPSISGSAAETSSQVVHWSRVIHVADEKLSSDTFGVPRMQDVFNYLINVRKVGGGSGQMFWRGGFPGLSIETGIGEDAAGIQMSPEDKKALKEDVERYQSSLQRYLTLVGLTAKTLAPQVADPTAHLDIQLNLVAVTKGIPLRILKGSEEAKQASKEDTNRWNGRLGRRCSQHIDPCIIRPFAVRLVEAGVLVKPAEINITRDAMDAPTETEKADVADKKTQAMAKYVSGNVREIMPPDHYLVEVMGMDSDLVETILEDAEEQQAEADADELENARLLAEEGLPDPNAPPVPPGKQPPAKGAPKTPPAQRTSTTPAPK